MSLLERVKEMKRDLSDLNEIKGNIDEISTEKLVGSYREINQIKKNINSFRDIVKDEIVDFRIFEDVSEGVDREEKGKSIYLEAMNERIRATKSIRKKLDKDRVKEELTEKGLYNSVVSKTGKMDNPDSYLAIVEDVMSFLEHISDINLVGEGDKAFELLQKMDQLIDIDIEENIDEDKLESLEKLEFIDSVDRFYDYTSYYSLYTIDKEEDDE